MWHMHIRIFFGWDCLDFGLIRCTASGRLSRLAIGIQNHRDGTAVASPLPFLSSGCTRNMPNILGALFREVGLQGSPKECFPGLVNFVTAVAYHFCLNLPIAFSQPGKHSFGDPCISVSLRHPFGRFSPSPLPCGVCFANFGALKLCNLSSVRKSGMALSLFCSSASGAAANAFSIRHGFSSELKSMSLDVTQLARAKVGIRCYFKNSFCSIWHWPLPYQILKVQ